MLKACTYCGRVHDNRIDCPVKRAVQRKYEKDSLASKTRNKSRWQKTRNYIRERDHQICQLCFRNYPGTIRPYETERLSVHHIVKIEEDASKAFDEDNLITLCRTHHEMADEGRVLQSELVSIARENGDKYHRQ